MHTGVRWSGGEKGVEGQVVGAVVRPHRSHKMPSSHTRTQLRFCGTAAGGREWTAANITTNNHHSPCARVCVCGGVCANGRAIARALKRMRLGCHKFSVPATGAATTTTTATTAATEIRAPAMVQRRCGVAAGLINTELIMHAGANELTCRQA